MTRKYLSWKLAAVPAALVFAAGAVATHAQPSTTPPAPPSGQPPQGEWAPPSPEQRQQNQEQRLRETLIKVGVTDTAQQDAIADFATAQETARRNLRDLGRKLSEATMDTKVTDAALSTQLAAFRAAVADEKKRSAASESELNAAIKYSSKPRLAAFLTTQGLIGDEAAYAGRPGGPGGAGPREGGPRGGGERGGRGGRRGGPRNGDGQDGPPPID